jgi:hypothetical protein
MAEDPIKAEEKKEEKQSSEQKQAILAPIMKSIQIALDSYDDIFSDFDESPYSSRVLSDDFLKEIKKRYYETKKGEFELRFTLPSAKRDSKVESIIKKRLRDYFKNEVDYFSEKIAKTKNEGLLRIFVGFFLLSLEVALDTFGVGGLYAKILSVIIVPAGWYGFYSGFEYFFEQPKEFESLRVFNEKFYKAKYEFVSEEDVLKSIEGMSEMKPQEQKPVEETHKTL